MGAGALAAGRGARDAAPLHLPRDRNGASLQTTGLRTVVHGPNSLLVGTKEADRVFEGLLSWAAEIGAAQVVYHARRLPDVPGSESALLFETRSLARLAMRAERLGITIAIENLAPVFPGIESLSANPMTLRGLVNRIGSDRVGICLDLGRAHIVADFRHTTVERLIEPVLDAVSLFHVHDNLGAPLGRLAALRASTRCASTFTCRSAAETCPGTGWRPDSPATRRRWSSRSIPPSARRRRRSSRGRRTALDAARVISREQGSDPVLPGDRGSDPAPLRRELALAERPGGAAAADAHVGRPLGHGELADLEGAAAGAVAEPVDEADDLDLVALRHLAGHRRRPALPGRRSSGRGGAPRRARRARPPTGVCERQSSDWVGSGGGFWALTTSRVSAPRGAPRRRGPRARSSGPTLNGSVASS